MRSIEAHARSIFLNALERASENCVEYVDRACASDAELRERVDELLQAHRELGIIDGGRNSESSSPSLSMMIEGPGTVIGPYRLLEQIGEGGFGIVYMAEQIQPVRRKVALKIIKPGMDTRLVIARFEAERQALALMDHPNIAQVFDGGATATGRPYFVMELVRGIPITEFCDQNLLPVKHRIDLFVAVCKAVQHAHQKGIIHRDIKPTNVLVTMHDDKRVVKVIDFGIAKAVGQQLTEKTLFTNFAQMIGTPPYMSPEQAQLSGLDVDTRSDIYSMGVLLYELLTGTTPFDQARLRTVALDEFRRIIREEEPPKPSTRLNATNDATVTASNKRGSDPSQLCRIIRGELDWIVMKCLEKDRNRRYETANSLAMDLHRYLKHEPVLACPPSINYRLRVFIRRHRASLYTAGLLLVVSMVGCAMTVWQAVRAASARDLAVRAQLALSETQQSAAVDRANSIAHDLETLNKANGFVESSRNHVDFSEWARAESDLKSALQLRPDHSSVWLTRGDLYARLDLWDLAAADFAQAFKLQEPISVNTLYLHSMLRLYMNDQVGYRSVCRRMVDRFHDDGDPKSWEKEEIARACLLAEQQVMEPDRLIQWMQRAVNSGKTPIRLVGLATAFYRAGQYESALERLEEIKPDNRRPEATWMNAMLAMIYHRLGEPEPAQKALQTAADLRRRSYQSGPESSGAAQKPHWWNEVQGAIYFREAKKLIDGVEEVQDHWGWTNRGDSFVALGRDREAIFSYGKAIQIAPDSVLALTRRSELYLQIGDWHNLLKDYDRLQTLQPENASHLNDFAWRLATCPDSKYRDYKRAADLSKKAVALKADIGDFWNTLGVILYRSEDWMGSATACLKSMELAKAQDIRDWLVLAMCEWRLGQKSRASRLLLHAIRRLPLETSQTEYLTEFRVEAEALIGSPIASLPTPTTRRIEDPSDFTLLLEIQPGANWIYALRGVACVSLKQWDQAAADLARASEAQHNNLHYWYMQAAARIGAGDIEAYRKVRKRILEIFKDMQNPTQLTHLCYISVVAPMTTEESAAFLHLARTAVGSTPRNPRVRGAMEFRAGHYAACIADLEKSSRVFTRRAWDWLFLAMAHQKLAHHAEAANCLKQAVKWIDQTNESVALGLSNPWVGWFEQVEVEQLLSETKALLQ